MNIILVGMLIALATLAMIPVIRKHIRRGAGDWASILITVSGTFLGFSLALLASEHQGHTDSKERLVGLLSSAEQATDAAIERAHDALAQARQHVDDPAYRETEEWAETVSSLALPDAFSPLLHSEELFLQLSPTMQRFVPRFQAAVEDNRSQLLRRKGSVLIAAKLVLADLEAQRACLRAEIDFQRGQYSSEQIEKALSDSLQNHRLGLGDIIRDDEGDDGWW